MKNTFLFLLIFTALSSCVPQRKVVYVQSNDEKREYEYLVGSRRNNKIEPFDVLYINVSSLDQPEYNFFSLDKQSLNTITDQTLSIVGYTVNDSGHVNLPVVGKIKVQGLTLDDAAGVIAGAIKTVLNNPIVSVRFVNNTISVLGEVTRPGTYSYTKPQLTILNALGLAGDITEYGNRRKVVLIREKNKTINKYHIDLTKDDIFKSDYYYLRPNDIVYVEPLKLRRFNTLDRPLSLVLSSITTLVLILTYIQK